MCANTPPTRLLAVFLTAFGGAPQSDELRKILDSMTVFQDLRPDQRQKFADYMDRRHLVVDFLTPCLLSNAADGVRLPPYFC